MLIGIGFSQRTRQKRKHFRGKEWLGNDVASSMESPLCYPTPAPRPVVGSTAGGEGLTWSVVVSCLAGKGQRLLLSCQLRGSWLGAALGAF